MGGGGGGGASFVALFGSYLKGDSVRTLQWFRI